MIELNDIEKAYGGQPVLRGISLTIPEGAVFGLLGPNGAGKTTLLSILFGLIPMDSGTLSVKKLDLRRELRRIRAFMGLVPQSLAFYPTLSARENLDFFASALGLSRSERRRRIAFCVETAGLETWLDRRSGLYSGGLKRRLNLAIGLLGNPRILCLDEPTIGIDPQSRSFILETIQWLNREGVTVIYTSHYMEEVQQICTDVAIIDEGRILVNDSLDSLLHNSSNRLEIGLSRPLPELLASTLALTAGDRRIRLAEATAEEISTLLKQLTEARIGVEYIDYGNRNLESLFLELTHRTLRD
ncbi:ABC transporter ATP-binding protein [Thiohalomonas denitrificans]|uniref:ABC transporter ATP-binding protein n=1 Tax=Thiohalomonas denitrificans TaxID=415747 RepID=UPI0026F1E8BC|nr:ABC transporter ATP-binding protein [Thiohalomonas denitrificans]